MSYWLLKRNGIQKPEQWYIYVSGGSHRETEEFLTSQVGVFSVFTQKSSLLEGKLC